MRAAIIRELLDLFDSFSNEKYTPISERTETRIQHNVCVCFVSLRTQSSVQSHIPKTDTNKPNGIIVFFVVDLNMFIHLKENYDMPPGSF